MNKLIIIPFLSISILACNSNSQKKFEHQKDESSKVHSQLTAEGNSNLDQEIMSFCRFAKIVDKDGYANIREKESSESRIVGKINSGEIVFIFEDLGTDWLSMDYDRLSDEPLQYIHRSRIKYINSYEQIPAVVYDDRLATFMLENIEVEITVREFDFNESKKYLTEEKHDEFLTTKFKGKEMWGTDGTVPKTFYESIIVSIGNEKIKIPQQDIEDLFNANNEYTECFYDSVQHSIYIHVANSDGAGSYVALFRIEKGEYKGRQVEIPF